MQEALSGSCVEVSMSVQGRVLSLASAMDTRHSCVRLLGLNVACAR